MGAEVAMWPLLVAMLAASVAVAAWPLRPMRLRMSILVAHLLMTWILVTTLGDPWQMWFIVLLPGMLITVIRLLMATATIVQRLQGSTQPADESRRASAKEQEAPGPHDQ